MKHETTIEYNGLQLEVVGVYIAGEDQVLYNADMGGHPGCASDFEIASVTLNDWDITVCLSDDDLTNVAEIVIKSIEE